MPNVKIFVGDNGFSLTDDNKVFDWYDDDAELLFPIRTESFCTVCIAADNSKILLKKITSQKQNLIYYGLESMYNQAGKRILLEREPLRPKLIAIGFDKSSKYLVTANAARTEYWDVDAFRVYSTEGEQVFVDENRSLIIAKQKEQIVLFNLLGQLITRLLKPDVQKIHYDENVGLLTIEYEHYFEYVNLDVPIVMDWIDTHLHKLNLEEKKKWIE